MNIFAIFNRPRIGPRSKPSTPCKAGFEWAWHPTWKIWYCRNAGGARLTAAIRKQFPGARMSGPQVNQSGDTCWIVEDKTGKSDTGYWECCDHGGQILCTPANIAYPQPGPDPKKPGSPQGVPLPGVPVPQGASLPGVPVQPSRPGSRIPNPSLWTCDAGWQWREVLRGSGPPSVLSFRHPRALRWSPLGSRALTVGTSPPACLPVRPEENGSTTGSACH